MTDKSIWYQKNLTLDLIQKMMPIQSTLVDHLGIVLTEVGANFLVGTMPVDERTKQPMGLLHGGASCALAETLGSIASYFVVDQKSFFAAGVSINADHILPVYKGYVLGRCTSIRLGKTTHFWDIRIYNDEKKVICASRLTVAIRDKRNS